MAETKKNYTFEIRDGQFHFAVRITADGKPHSITGAYPFVQQTEEGLKWLTKRETEKWCSAYASEQGWYPTEEQVNKQSRRKKRKATATK